MAITVLAAGLPLLFYAAIPLKSSFDSLRSLQDDYLRSKMSAAESMLRMRRQTLEETANLIAAFPEIRRFAVDRQKELWGSRGKKTHWNRMGGGRFHGIDLIYLASPEGEVEFLSVPPANTDPKIYREPIENWNRTSLEEAPSTSGFCGLGGRKFLLAIARIADPDPAVGAAFLALGVELEEDERVAELFGLGAGEASLSVDASGALAHSKTDPVTFVESDLEVGIRKPLKNLDLEDQFLLTLYHSRGRYDEIESHQIWFFVLFLLGAYLAAVFATAGSAAVVLRPLGRLIETMRSVSGPSTYSHRAPEDRKDEIGQLAINFNRLMRRLQVAQRELQIAQKHAIEAEKLETVHAMVITLAHEINNPLTALLGEAEMLLMDGRLVPADRSSVEVIRNMSMRIQRVIAKLQDVQAVEMTAYTDWQQMIKIDLDDVKSAAASSQERSLAVKEA